MCTQVSIPVDHINPIISRTNWGTRCSSLLINTTSFLCILQVSKRVNGLPDQARVLFGKNLKHSCEVCGLTFLHHSSLRTHQMIHTGLKPFKCPLCAYASNRNYCITRHLKQCHGKDRYSDMPGAWDVDVSSGRLPYNDDMMG